MAEGAMMPVNYWFCDKWKSVAIRCSPAEAAAHPVGPVLKTHSILPTKPELRVETEALYDRQQRNDSLIDQKKKK